MHARGTSHCEYNQKNQPRDILRKWGWRKKNRAHFSWFDKHLGRSQEGRPRRDQFHPFLAVQGKRVCFLCSVLISTFLNFFSLWIPGFCLWISTSRGFLGNGSKACYGLDKLLKCEDKSWAGGGQKGCWDLTQNCRLCIYSSVQRRKAGGCKPWPWVRVANFLSSPPSCLSFTAFHSCGRTGRRLTAATILTREEERSESLNVSSLIRAMTVPFLIPFLQSLFALVV